MEKKILVMGKHTIEKNHWSPLKQLMGLPADSKEKITVINKPLTHILTRDEIKEYDLILSLQNNPILLRRVWKMASDCNVPIVKPFRNKEKVLTHFMKIDEILIDYKYELVKIDNGQKPKQVVKRKNKENLK